jgi:hypothetical protein
MPHLPSGPRPLAVAFLALAAFLLGAVQAGAATFSNATPIAIPGGSGTLGNASVYPSQIAVSGMTGTVQKATVTFKGYAHECPIDTDFLLVGPAGQSAILMSDAGDCANETPLRPGVDLTFDDAAQNSVPCVDFNSTPSRLPGGTYRPTDYSPRANGVQSLCDPSTDNDHHSPPPPGGQGALADVFTGLIRPIGGWGHSLGAFNSSDPNGIWSLYATDQYTMSVGKMAGGWILNIATSATPTPPTPSLPQQPNIAAKLTTSAFKSKQKVLKQRGVRATLTSTVAGNLAASGTLKVGKTYKLKAVKSKVFANKRVTVTLKLPKSAAAAARKALARHRKLKARITLVLTTASGLKTTVHKTVTLAR